LRAQHLDIARVRSQDDDAGIRGFSSNTDDCVDTVQRRHLELHQSHIRPVQSELFDRFLSVGSFRDQLHIGLSVYQRCDSLAEQRVVVYGKNANHSFAAFLPKSLRTLLAEALP
jgi:hypothetical protein